MRRYWQLIFGAVLLPFLVGCGEEVPKITGTVTYAGEPLARGLLTFHPIDRHAVAAQARVSAGQFAVPVQPGTYRIQVMNLDRPAEPDYAKMEYRVAIDIYRARQQERKERWKRELRPFLGNPEALRAKYAEMQELEGDIPDAAPGNNQTHEITAPDQVLTIVVERYSKKAAPRPAGS